MDENLTYDEIVAQQSGINDEQETTDEDQEVEETGDIDSASDSDSEDSEESDDSEQEEEKEIQEKHKKPQNGYARLLAERNAMKKQLEAIKGWYEKKSIQDIDAIATQRAEQIIEEKLFFRDNPLAQEMAEDIKFVAKEHNMDIATAYRFHLAMTNPEALIDPQTVAKKEAKKYSVSWTAKVVKSTKTSDEDGYAQADAYYKSRD